MTDPLTPAYFSGRKPDSTAHLKFQGGGGWLYQWKDYPRFSIMDKTMRGKASREFLVDGNAYSTIAEAIAAHNGEPMPEAPEKKKYSIDAQISEVERELGMRKKVYGNMIFPNATFKREAEATMAREIMESVLETVKWAKENRDDVIAWVRAGKPQASAA